MEYFKTVMHKSKSVVSVGVETWLKAVQSLGEWRVAMRPKVDPVSLKNLKVADVLFICCHDSYYYHRPTS